MGKLRQREEGTQAFWGINSISAFPLLVRMHEDVAVPPRSSACFLCEVCADVAVISRSKHIDCDWWPACRLDCAPAPLLPEAGCASTLASRGRFWYQTSGSTTIPSSEGGAGSAGRALSLGKATIAGGCGEGTTTRRWIDIEFED